MTDQANVAAKSASLEEMQQAWHDLVSRLGQLETEYAALVQENKSLRFLLERVVEHRQKSHSELVMVLTDLVSRLPMNDIGAIVSRLVEHNANVGRHLAALVKGAAEADLPQPVVLRTLDQTRRSLADALKGAVEELIQMDTPLETTVLQSLLTQSDHFFSPRAVRAQRCFVKGQVPRERIVREFGEQALPLFKDMTTDSKLNPHPKPEEIVLAFRSDFDTLLEQHTALPPEKRQELRALNQKIQRSKASTEQARSQRNAFVRLSFIIELLHFYEHQNTEAPDVIFAQRLPALVEQLVLGGPQEAMDEKAIVLVEDLIAHVINPEHRLMIINNLGKGGGAAKIPRFVLRLRAEKAPDPEEVITELVRHLIPPAPQKAQSAEAGAAILRLVPAPMQQRVIRAVMTCDRMRREDSELLGKAIAELLGLKAWLEQLKTQETLSPEVERKQAWARIKELMVQRGDAAAIATAIRDRLHAKYTTDEIRQSWITLTEADPILLIRIFCHLPYLPNGTTDPIARTVMEAYASRLVHEKYKGTYQKLVKSLRNIFKAKADSPTLLSFVALLKWASPEAADKLSADVGLSPGSA